MNVILLKGGIYKISLVKLMSLTEIWVGLGKLQFMFNKPFKFSKEHRTKSFDDTFAIFEKNVVKPAPGPEYKLLNKS